MCFKSTQNTHLIDLVVSWVFLIQEKKKDMIPNLTFLDLVWGFITSW